MSIHFYYLHSTNYIFVFFVDFQPKALQLTVTIEIHFFSRVGSRPILVVVKYTVIILSNPPYWTTVVIAGRVIYDFIVRLWYWIPRRHQNISFSGGGEHAHRRVPVVDRIRDPYAYKRRTLTNGTLSGNDTRIRSGRFENILITVLTRAEISARAADLYWCYCLSTFSFRAPLYPTYAHIFLGKTNVLTAVSR